MVDAVCCSGTCELVVVLLLADQPELNKSYPSEYYGYASNATNLTCVAWGLPKPVFRWHRREAEIFNGINDTFWFWTEFYSRYTVSHLQVYSSYSRLVLCIEHSDSTVQ